MTATEETGSFLDPSILSDPYAFYQFMHSNLPVVQVPDLGFYLVSRYDDVMGILKDDDTYSSEVASKMTTGLSMNPPRASVDEVLARGYPHVDSLAWLDPPAHTRQRTMVTAALSPRRIRLLEEQITRTATELVDGWPDSGEIELMDRFGYPLPIAVIGAILGVPHDTLGQLARWGEAVLNRLGKVLTEEEDLVEAQHVVDFQNFMVGLVDERRGSGRDDLLSDLVASGLEGEDPLSMPEFLSLLLTLLVAGHDTSASLIGSLVSELAQRPEAMARVRKDRSLIAGAIEETLRFQCPVPLFTRMTKCPVQIAGVDIPAGELVMPMFGAANVDASRYPDPLEFDIERPNARSHLAFSFGLHYCPGAPLAKREAQIGLNVLLDRFSTIELAPGFTPEYEANFRIRSVKELRLVVAR